MEILALSNFYSRTVAAVVQKLLKRPVQPQVRTFLVFVIIVIVIIVVCFRDVLIVLVLDNSCHVYELQRPLTCINVGLSIMNVRCNTLSLDSIKRPPPYSYGCSFNKCWPISMIFRTRCTELICNIGVTDLPTSLTYCCYTRLLRETLVVVLWKTMRQ